MFVELDYEIGQTKFYLMPIKIQQSFRIITIAVQQPVILDGFGSVVGSRVVFQQVKLTNAKCQKFNTQISSLFPSKIKSISNLFFHTWS